MTECIGGQELRCGEAPLVDIQAPAPRVGFSFVIPDVFFFFVLESSESDEAKMMGRD